MDRLLEELTGQGLLGVIEAEWARAYGVEHHIPIDSALLELDLVDEDGVLRALGSCAGVAPASPTDLVEIDVESAQRLPQSFAKAFSMCPLRQVENRVVALVERPLADEWIQELRDVFRIDLEQRVAPTHYLLLARERVYGVHAGEQAHALETRLERRRKAENVAGVLSRWQAPTSLSSALMDVLSFATARVEYACFFVRQGETVRVLTADGDHTKGFVVALPHPDSKLWPALAHGGYFLGPLDGTDLDRRFYETLRRSPPRWACVIPAAIGSTISLSLHCDNGDRGMATRWVGELALLVSRIGQRNARTQAPDPPMTLSAATPEPSELTAMERGVLDKLRRASNEANMPLDAFVDGLLAPRAAQPVADASMLAGEVKGFFDRLATEIPAQLARGMEAAFRDLAPRVGGVPASPRASPPQADVDVVLRPEAPAAREIASYESRRRKATRVKM